MHKKKKKTLSKIHEMTGIQS